MQLRVGWRYLVAFAALTILCGTSHEFAHHFAGALVCGEFGSKTFNSFTLAPGCESSAWRAWPTIAGPLFTFALMWLGAVRLRNPDERQRQLGFALVFANFPINRMGFVLFGWNDEQWVARHEFGASPVAFWLAVAAVWIACLPPLIAAWRAIETAAGRSGSPGSSSCPSSSSCCSQAVSSRNSCCSATASWLTPSSACRG